MKQMSKLNEKLKSVGLQLLIASAFVAISCVTSTAQTSTASSTTPTPQIVEPVKTVTISQEDADRCANNTTELVAARDEIKTYVDEIKSRDKQDGQTEKLLALYEKGLNFLDKVIIAQDRLSTDKTELIRAQTDFIKTLLEMRQQKKSSPIEKILSFVGGIFLGRASR